LLLPIRDRTEVRAVRYVVLAAGFDGTLAREGRCDARSDAILRALAASGRKLILVTSRELRDVLDVFPQASLFDYLVAENGAVVHRPAARESEILAPAPSEVLVHELRRREVEPLSVGSVVVSTRSDYREALANIIQRLRLDCHLLDNGTSVAALPTGVSKASGVERVLEELGLSAHNLVAIGDAENDIALFELAEHGAAVANASPSLKRIADRVTRASYADGFVEVARELLESDLLGAPTRHRIVIGTRGGHHEVSVPPAACSILLSGPSASGKAALCNNVVSQYLLQRYQCCIVGAYGQPGQLEDIEGLTICGDEHHAPKHADALASLEQPAQSVVVNVHAVRASARAGFVEQLIEQLAGLQTRTGRPHAIVFDQADGLLSNASAARCAQLKTTSVVYISTRPQDLPRMILESVEIVVALGDVRGTLESIPDAAAAGAESALEPGQALLWFRESGTAPFRVELDSRPASFRVIPDATNGTAAQGRTRSSRIQNNEAALP
jgi:hydroxymethylpyrimidine pyrophosphatase-like HAD family hydrolase